MWSNQNPYMQCPIESALYLSVYYIWSERLLLLGTVKQGQRPNNVQELVQEVEDTYNIITKGVVLDKHVKRK